MHDLATVYRKAGWPAEVKPDAFTAPSSPGPDRLAVERQCADGAAAAAAIRRPRGD